MMAAPQVVLHFPVVTKLNLRLLSILDDNDVEPEMQNALAQAGGATRGLFTGVACDKKELHAEFLEDSMNLDSAAEPDKALKFKIIMRTARLICARGTCAERLNVEVKA